MTLKRISVMILRGGVSRAEDRASIETRLETTSQSHLGKSGWVCPSRAPWRLQPTWFKGGALIFFFSHKYFYFYNLENLLSKVLKVASKTVHSLHRRCKSRECWLWGRVPTITLARLRQEDRREAGASCAIQRVPGHPGLHGNDNKKYGCSLRRACSVHWHLYSWKSRTDNY